MEILANEVKSVDILGRLHGEDVKLIRTHGGYFIAVGHKNKNSKKMEALAAASHPALVCYQISKQFKEFQPTLQKSEQKQLEKVENNTEFLPQKEINKGLELFTLSKNENFDFILYKHGLTLAHYKGHIEANKMIVNPIKISEYLISDNKKELAKSIVKSITAKAKECQVKKTVINNE